MEKILLLQQCITPSVRSIRLHFVSDRRPCSQPMAARAAYLLPRLRAALTTAPARLLMTSPARLEKALEALQENPFYNKYAQKLASAQQTSPEEFLARLEDTEAMKKPKIGTVDTRQYSSVLNPKESLKEKIESQEKRLEGILKVELVRDKDPEEIKLIWEEYHKNKDVIAAIIPKNAFETIKDMMQKHSTFIFPLPRSQGYEFILSQSLGNTVHFTPLLAYQVHKENAPECLTMVHYTELSDKGIILMRGEFDKNVIDGKEAQCLANQFQLYYNHMDDSKRALLEAFTVKPDSFKHMDVISELENLTIP